MSYFKRPAEFYRRNAWWSYPDTLRLRGSVIPTVVTDVVVITSFSALVMFVHSKDFIGSLIVPGVVVPALSVVVGLILAFRTNTAYDRFWEGRKLWSSLDVQIRNFSRMIWVGMKETPHTIAATAAPKVRSAHHLFGRTNSTIQASSLPKSKKTISPTTTLIDIDGDGRPDHPDHHAVHGDDHEKILVVKLLLAYAVAVKHHLRQEFGTRYHDLEGLLPEGFEPCPAMDHQTRPVHDRALGDRFRHYSQVPWDIHPGNEDGQMSLPLEIAHGLSLWVVGESRAGRIESSLVGNLLGSINTMTDIFTNMERIVFTPIPLAYSIHLRQVVYLYCLALPFTFIGALDWGTVPLMALVSFTLFGMEGIGREIENPFGKDANDLHMDEFCRDLKRELDYTVTLQNTIPGAHV